MNTATLRRLLKEPKAFTLKVAIAAAKKNRAQRPRWMKPVTLEQKPCS